MRNPFFMILSAIFLCAGMSMLGAAELPCFVHQVSRVVDSGTSVAITGNPSGSGACQYSFGNSPFVALQYQLQRQDQSGEMVTIGYFGASYKLTSNRNRRNMLVLNSLEDGEYRLLTINSNNFLEAVYFSVGGTVGINRLDLSIPYAQAAALAHNGYLYFRGHLGRNAVASGYLYQDQADGRTEMIQVEFFAVDPQNNDLMINQSFIRGGIMDLPWVRVKLPNNDIDPNRSINACLTTDGGGATACFRVYDPSNPMKMVDGFAPSSR